MYSSAGELPALTLCLSKYTKKLTRKQIGAQEMPRRYISPYNLDDRMKSKFQHDSPDQIFYQKTSISSPLNCASSMMSTCRTNPNVNESSPISLPTNYQQMKMYKSGTSRKTEQAGLFRRSFSKIRTAICRMSLTSKSFDGEMIDRLIRPSPFKKRSHHSMS